ncbi:reverse transcriptase [Phytophthora megakarya]|uniref:Reverse transcriptase n=1 Tax=Phytophthora megakarya TaxID=4795 RepID=A0A225VKK4_9STRA|nr:reverse transcriptase [Phytophthora megakarya]
MEWQNLALEAMTYARSEDVESEVPLKPAVERSEYKTPHQPGASDLDLTWDLDQDCDECVYYHERSDLYAEGVDGQIAVLPEVPVTTEDMKIDDIQLCESGNQTPEEMDRLR